MTKRHRKSGGGPTPKKKRPDDSNQSSGVRKNRRRPRTAGLRKQVVSEIERALKTKNHPIGELFQRRRDHGDLYAFFDEVIAILKVNAEKVMKISKEGLLRMNDLTTVFEIEEDPETKRLMVIYAPIGDPHENTVYLDRLPPVCNEQKLRKLLIKFGNVVAVEIPQRTDGRRLSGNLGFAFAQFVEKDSAERLIQRYSKNAPGKQPPSVLTIVNLWRKLRRWKKVRRHQCGRLTRKQRAEMQPIFTAYKRYRAKHFRVLLKDKKHVNGAGVSLRKRRSHSMNQGHRDHKHRFRKLTAEINWPYLRRLKKERKHRRLVRNKRRLARRKNRRAQALYQKKTLPKRLRFRRRLRSRGGKPGYIHCSIDEYFENIQVISLTEYNRLKAEYQELQHRSFVKFAAQAESCFQTKYTNDNLDNIYNLRDTNFLSLRDENDEFFDPSPPNCSPPDPELWYDRPRTSRDILTQRRPSRQLSNLLYHSGAADNFPDGGSPPEF